MAAAGADSILFVTGKLAEPALQRTVAELSSASGIKALVAVLPISVAALLTTDWIASHLQVPAGTDRVMVPGFCRGDLADLANKINVPVERGPKDLRDLPEHFGRGASPPVELTDYDIEIIAEINHARTWAQTDLLARAQQYRTDGANVIDLGCDPGEPWTNVGDAVKALCAAGLRVSIDSFDPHEVMLATKAGAELVLSVNSSNVAVAADWGVEVVAIPDDPATLAGLDNTVDLLTKRGAPFRIDPILEPIGFGFAVSLGRYLEVRRRYPNSEIMMGVGNLTELTDADSAAINVVLAGFCQEVGIRSVLTTEVINWARSCVQELDLARRLMYHAVNRRVLPKRLCPELLLLRDPKLNELGVTGLAELANSIKDGNYRLFAEGGKLHCMNGQCYMNGTDPFALFAEMQQKDAKISPSHAFYLGYEMAKAVTALTLGKQYNQDQPLQWGFLTRPEESHHDL